MSDNRKYYYLKLKENYFDDDSIVLLESMQDGVLYSNIPAQAVSEIAETRRAASRLTREYPLHGADDRHYSPASRSALWRGPCKIFLKLGLVEVLDSGTFYMSNIELLIGQSSTEAERKSGRRGSKTRLLSTPRTKVGHLSDIRPPEIEIELEGKR